MRHRCSPTLLARFVEHGAAPELFNRHTGCEASGALEPLDFRAWYNTGARIPLETFE